MQSTGVSRDVSLILLCKFVEMKQGPAFSTDGKMGENQPERLSELWAPKKAACMRRCAQAALHKVLYKTNYNWAPEFYVICKTYSLIIAAINFSGVPSSEHQLQEQPGESWLVLLGDVSITTGTLMERNGLLLSDKQMKRLCLTGKREFKVGFCQFYSWRQSSIS